MAFSNEKYKVKITDECIEEIEQIYDYIANDLNADKSAVKVVKEFKTKILTLSETPKLYPKINKRNRAKKTYRRLIVKNFIVLYTVDDNQKLVFISHIFFNRKNYL